MDEVEYAVTSTSLINNAFTNFISTPFLSYYFTVLFLSFLYLIKILVIIVMSDDDDDDDDV